jgi:D-glycero-D-manno-heptose 1,7-bisphosphate phosphatase
MTIKTIFLDRDGVINIEKNYLYKIEDFEFINGVFSTCEYLKELGYEIIIITNQSGISRNLYSENDFKKLTFWMRGQFSANGVEILDVFYCPHLPTEKCSCRKPEPGMLIEARIKYNIDMENSWLIGDKEVDISAAINANITNSILVRSGHKLDEKSSKAKYIINSINDLREVIFS